MAQNTPKPTWAVVATLKEPQQTVEEFIAHYTALGAEEIHIFFDDPEDVAYDIAKGLPRVFPTLCDDAFWNGDRPERHQRRQKLNARRAYAASACDWVIHLDGDEFLYCPHGVANLLARQSPDEDALRVVPAEPLIQPRTGEIKAYNSPLPLTRLGNRIGHKAFGEIYPLLSVGMLSHAAGKFFLRTGLPGAPITIHRPEIAGKARIPTLPVDDILLLHHHGCDEDHWVSKYDYRIKNTYSAQFWDNKPRTGRVDGLGLNGFLTKTYEEQGEDGLRAFYRKVFHIDKNKSVLRRVNAIHRPKIWLEQKRADLFQQGNAYCYDMKVNADSGRLEAKTRLFDFDMIIQPDFNYTEQVLATGRVPEKAELQAIHDIAKGRTLQFWDIGANTGLFSLLTAAAANKDSRITAFEPLPVMIAAMQRNVALNGFENITIEPVALGSDNGEADFFVAENLGQSSLLASETAQRTTVRVARLADYIRSAGKAELSVMKIDVEGAEPIVLDGFFEDTPEALYPDYILYEHQHAESWSKPVDQVFPRDKYDEHTVFAHNTLLARA